MKFGFCTNVFSDDDMWFALKALRQMGYDGVEFWDNYLVKTDIAQLGAYLVDLGLEVLQICPYFNVAGSEEELARTMEIATKYIEFAKMLNCNLIRTFTGSVSSDNVEPQIYQQAVNGLREICALGSKAGISFALETHEGSLMDTGPATLKLIQDVGAENLKVNLQVPLDGGREDISQSVELLGKHTVHIHAHNWIGSWPNFTFLEQGDYNFQHFLMDLQKHGFDGTISIEHGSHSGLSPLEIARREIEYLRQLSNAARWVEPAREITGDLHIENPALGFWAMKGSLE